MPALGARIAKEWEALKASDSVIHQLTELDTSWEEAGYRKASIVAAKAVRDVLMKTFAGYRECPHIDCKTKQTLHFMPMEEGYRVLIEATKQTPPGKMAYLGSNAYEALSVFADPCDAWPLRCDSGHAFWPASRFPCDFDAFLAARNKNRDLATEFAVRHSYGDSVVGVKLTHDSILANGAVREFSAVQDAAEKMADKAALALRSYLMAGVDAAMESHRLLAHAAGVGTVTPAASS